MPAQVLPVISGPRVAGSGRQAATRSRGDTWAPRTDTGAVRSGAKAARVEGVVVSETLPEFVTAVDECGGEVEDDRVVLAPGVSEALAAFDLLATDRAVRAKAIAALEQSPNPALTKLIDAAALGSPNPFCGSRLRVRRAPAMPR